MFVSPRGRGLAALLVLCSATLTAGVRSGVPDQELLAQEEGGGRPDDFPVDVDADALIALATQSNSSAAERRYMEEQCEEQHTCATCAAVKGCKWCAEGKCRTSGWSFGGFFSKCSKSSGCPASPAPAAPFPPVPEEWFLTEAEIVKARGGRKKASKRNEEVFTKGNKVTFLQTGSDVFREFEKDLLQTEAGDFALVSGFSLALDLPLTPERSEHTMKEDLRDAMERDVRVRILLRRNLRGSMEAQYKVQDDFTARVPPKSKKPNGSRSRFLMDARMDFPMGAIHQKFTIVKHHGALHAMVGGIDLDKDRWDTVEHDNTPARQLHYMHEGGLIGWIDRHVKVEGPGAADLANSFAERWNSNVPFGVGGVKKAAAYAAMNLVKLSSTQFYRTDPLGEEVDPEQWAKPHEEEEQGTVASQVIYTNPPELHMGDMTTRHFDYAPAGDYTYLASYVKAVGRAKEYIYIEDQYGMFIQDLYDALAGALERGLQKLVVVYAHTSSVNGLGCGVRRHKMWQPLKDAYPDRVHLLVRKDAVFIHSKMWMVDDTWVAIGSSNIGHRSFTWDPEIGVALVDTETVATPDGIRTRFGFETRTRCISELAKVPVAKVAKLPFKDAFDLLRAPGSSMEEVLEVPKILGHMPESVGDTMCGKTDTDARSYFR